MATDSTIILNETEIPNENIYAKIHFALLAEDENRLKLELHPDTLKLIQYNIRLMNQRKFTQLGPVFVSEMYDIFASHGVQLSIWSEEYSYDPEKYSTLKFLRAKNDFPLIYTGSTQLNALNLIRDLSKFEQKMGLFLNHIKKYFYDKYPEVDEGTAYREQGRPSMLPEISELVERYDWNRLGYVCGRTRLLRTCIKTLTLKAVSCRYEDKKTMVYPLIGRLYREYPFSPLYFEAFLQRVVCDREVTDEHKCKSIVNMVQLLTRTFDMPTMSNQFYMSRDFGNWVREEILMCCLAIFTCIALNQLECASAIAKLLKKLPQKCKIEKFLPYSVAFSDFVEYLEKMNQDEISSTEFNNIGERLLKSASRLSNGSYIFLIDAAFRAINRADGVTEDIMDLLTELSHKDPRIIPVIDDRLRKSQNLQEAEKFLDDMIPHPLPDIHSADAMWIGWCQMRTDNPENYGTKADVGVTVAKIMMAFLDYAGNRSNQSAWIILHSALEYCDCSGVSGFWDVRKRWWRAFHENDIGGRGERKKKEVFQRLLSL